MERHDKRRKILSLKDFFTLITQDDFKPFCIVFWSIFYIFKKFLYWYPLPFHDFFWICWWNSLILSLIYVEVLVFGESFIQNCMVDEFCFFHELCIKTHLFYEASMNSVIERLSISRMRATGICPLSSWVILFDCSPLEEEFSSSIKYKNRKSSMEQSLFMYAHFFSRAYLLVVCINENNIFHVGIIAGIFFFQKSSWFFFPSSIMRTILIMRSF